MRDWSRRRYRTVHDDIRDRRAAAMRASVLNLIAITEAEIARIDAGLAHPTLATPARRAALVAEISQYRNWLDTLEAPAETLAAEQLPCASPMLSTT